MFGLFKFLVSIPIIVAIISPRFTWEITEGWKYKEAEPSGFYLIMTRVMSVIMLIFLWFILRI